MKSGFAAICIFHHSGFFDHLPSSREDRFVTLTTPEFTIEGTIIGLSVAQNARHYNSLHQLHLTTIASAVPRGRRRSCASPRNDRYDLLFATNSYGLLPSKRINARCAGDTYLTLHGRTGGSSDDLLLELTTDHFNGLEAAGTWTLKVVDSAGIDTGSVVGWSIEL